MSQYDPDFEPDTSAAPAEATASAPRPPGAIGMRDYLAPAGPLALRALPFAVAAGLTALAPEGLPFWAGLLARGGMALSGGMAGEAGREAAMREKLDPKRILTAGLEQGALQPTGELTALGGKTMAEGLMGQSLKPAAATTKQAMRVAKQHLGRYVAPEEASLAKQALREGFPVGKGAGVTGSTLVDNEIGSLGTALHAPLADAGASGTRFTAFDATGPVAELRAELARETNGAQKLQWLDRQLKKFIDQHRNGPKLTRYTPEEFNKLKQTWQSEAEPLYLAREQKGTVLDTRQGLQARLADALARGARQSIEGQIPAVGPINARIASLMPLRRAMVAAEASPHQAVSLGEFLPPATNLAVPRVLRTRALASRLALSLDNPASQWGQAQLPRFLALGLTASQPQQPSPYDPGFEPDTTHAGP